MADIKIIDRSIAEMDQPTFAGLADDFGVVALTTDKRRAFSNNPYITDCKMHCQSIGVLDGLAIGCEMHFPLYWMAHGALYRVLCGSTTFVAKEYRKTELGLQLKEFRKQVCPSEITCGAGVSQMMLRILRYWKETVFLIPRIIMLFKSRAVVDMKLHGMLAKIVSTCVDLGLTVYWVLIRFMCWYKLRAYDFEKVDASNEDVIRQVADLISSDPHPFAELHDDRWLKWHMTESFTKDGAMELTTVRHKGKLVAFYMTKKRFHEQASSRGFRNVWLGSITEWQVVHGSESVLPWILLNAACAFKGAVDAVEIVAEDGKLLSFLRRLGWQHVGESNFTFHIYDGPLKENKDILDCTNWRLRPAMGDAGLS